MIRTLFRVLGCFLLPVLCLILPATSRGVTTPCPPFYLKTNTGEIINPITGENADQPYSTRQTCGACHEVDKISKGYHFVMDWDKADDERFRDTETPWMVSTGLTGKLIPYGFFQLAKKKNTHAHEIDLSVFDFVARTPEPVKGYQKPGCAACHAGGGIMEFDRDGFRYDRRLAENPGLANTLDGDYYQSRWDQTGVIEPDCFLCHASRYNIQTRIMQIKNLNFKWAGVAAAGIGQVYGKVIEGEVPRVVYNKRLFNEDGTFYLPDMVFKPRAENCLICHATIELGKRGTTWDDPDNPDVHHLAGLTCIDCHFGDIAHNFAKGNAMDITVADDLDNTMRSCRDCHTQGYKGATRMRHRGIRKDHLDKLSCEACHIPELNRSAVGAMFLNTGVFGKQGQVNTTRFGENRPWKPAYVIRKKDKDQIPRITPVNPMVNTLFTNRDSNGKYAPLFLSEVAAAYKTCQDKMSPRQIPYDFHDPKNILLMLDTLSRSLGENRRFTKVSPCFHTGGNLYALKKEDASLEIQKDFTWVSRIPSFSISHNVAPSDRALGANGCVDCHSKNSHLFAGRVVKDYFGDNGKPITLSMAQFLDLPDPIQKWNPLFANYLEKAIPILATSLFVLGGMVAIRLFMSCRALSAPSRIWGIGVVWVITFCLAHVWVVKDRGILTSLYEMTLDISSLPGLFLMLVSAAGYFYLIRKMTPNKFLLRGLQLLGILTAGTGMVLWIHPLGGLDSTLFISGLHGISAMVTALCFLLLVFVKTPCMPG